MGWEIPAETEAPSSNAPGLFLFQSLHLDMTIDRAAIEPELIRRLSSGESMRKICADGHMPDRGTLMNWMAEDESFATRCARARIQAADAIEDDMAEIEDRTISGEIDPAAARAVLSSKQWRASKMAPKKYGDKLQAELSGPDGGPIAVQTITRRIVKPE